MKKILILFFLLIFSPFVFTQTVDGQFIVLTNDGANYSIKVQIKLQSGSQNLGNGTIRFSFNQTDLSFPSSPVEGTNYSFNNFQGGDYSSTVSRPNPNTVSINIAYTGGSGTAVNTTYIDVATINFTTSNSAGNSNLVWGTRELYTISSPTAWVLGSWLNEDTSPLPVELNSFVAQTYSDTNVKLNWETQTEVNNYGFEVERKVHTSTSLSVTTWEKVGFVNGNGNSNSPKEYSFVDSNPTGGSKYLYRLKQVDNDGQFEYSDAVEVEIVPKEFTLYQNYPNPFNPVTRIRYQLPQESKVVIKIYNILGAEVLELLNVKKEAGIYEVEFKAQNLPSGTYIYRIIADNFTQTNKMILLK